MLKFWVLLTACVTLFLCGGQLNLHLPSIFIAEAGKTPVEAAVIYSVYNIAAFIGKILSAFVVSKPSCKKSFLIYILCRRRSSPQISSDIRDGTRSMSLCLIHRSVMVVLRIDTSKSEVGDWP